MALSYDELITHDRQASPSIPRLICLMRKGMRACKIGLQSHLLIYGELMKTEQI